MNITLGDACSGTWIGGEVTTTIEIINDDGLTLIGFLYINLDGTIDESALMITAKNFLEHATRDIHGDTGKDACIIRSGIDVFNLVISCTT